MSLLVVGSVALDSIYTPFGETADALGGSAVYFSVAGALLHKVNVVGVVGNDYPVAELERLASRGIDWSGVEHADGESFRWKGKYSRRRTWAPASCSSATSRPSCSTACSTR